MIRPDFARIMCPQHSFGTQTDAEHVHVEHLLPACVVGENEAGNVVSSGGIVHQDVDAPESCHCVRHELRDGIMVADVGPNGHGDAAFGRDEIAEFVQLCASTHGQHNLRASSGKCKGDFATNTSPSAGHDSDLAIKRRAHRPQP